MLHDLLVDSVEEDSRATTVEKSGSGVGMVGLED